MHCINLRLTLTLTLTLAKGLRLLANLNSCLDKNFWVQLRPFAKTFCLSKTWPHPLSWVLVLLSLIAVLALRQIALHQLALRLLCFGTIIFIVSTLCSHYFGLYFEYSLRHFFCLIFSLSIVLAHSEPAWVRRLFPYTDTCSLCSLLLVTLLSRICTVCVRECIIVPIKRWLKCLNQEVIYNYKADLAGTGNWSTIN